MARKEWLAGDCTCGTYNLGVIVGERLAVLQMDLGDHLGSRDLANMERDLVDRALQVDTRGPSPAVVRHEWRSETPEPLRPLAARFPGGEFDRRLPLGDGWKAQHIRVAAIPRVTDGHEDMAASLHTLSAVSARPAPAAVIEWPEFGARLDADGMVILLVPGFAEGEIGPKARVWFLLEYNDGRLTTAVVRSSWGWAGATYVWPEAGNR